MLHITRASSQGVCHCTCKDALMSIPDQLDCPWCGCGWLFSCHRCGKAFTFGKAIRTDQKVRDFILRDFRQRDLPAELLNNPEFIDGCVEAINEMFERVEVGKEYVYLDGELFPADHEGPLEFEGLYAEHALDRLPHQELRDDPDAARHLLADPRYWMDRELPPIDDEDDLGDDQEEGDDEGFDDEDDEQGDPR